MVMGIALRPHGHHQRPCRLVIGKRMFTDGLCQCAMYLGLRKKSGPSKSNGSAVPHIWSNIAWLRSRWLMFGMTRHRCWCDGWFIAISHR